MAGASSSCVGPRRVLAGVRDVGLPQRARLDAASSERRLSPLGLATVAAGMSVLVAWLGDEPFWLELLSEVPRVVAPIAVGDAVRSRRERLVGLIDAEAEARVHAERLRIARDLHDVAAHGSSRIAIQAGVAAHLLDDDPERARAVLSSISVTGRASLDELQAMVGVLRSAVGAGLRPLPTVPNNLRALIADRDDVRPRRVRRRVRLRRTAFRGLRVLGFLLKHCEPQTLLDGIRTVVAGEALIAPSATRRLVAEFAMRPRTGGTPDLLMRLTARDQPTDDSPSRLGRRRGPRHRRLSMLSTRALTGTR